MGRGISGIGSMYVFLWKSWVGTKYGRGPSLHRLPDVKYF